MYSTTQKKCIKEIEERLYSLFMTTILFMDSGHIKEKKGSAGPFV